MTADRWTTRDLSLAYLASTVVAVLMTVASAVGLISGSSPTPAPMRSFYPCSSGRTRSTSSSACRACSGRCGWRVAAP